MLKPISDDQEDESEECLEPILTSGTSSQGLSYIAGFLAKKLASKYPHLGSRTCDMDISSDTSSTWIESLSRGGLTVPSDSFLIACHAFEKEFNLFHNSHENHVDEGLNVTKRMTSLLMSKHPSWPEDILKLFVKTRTFIRLKYLNNLLKATGAKAKLRQLKQIGQFQY